MLIKALVFWDKIPWSIALREMTLFHRNLLPPSSGQI
jgi:hypothetical protein